MLHFIVDFFYNPRASLARTEFKRDFLDNHGARRSIAFKTFFDPRYRPPTPVLVMMMMMMTMMMMMMMMMMIQKCSLNRLKLEHFVTDGLYFHVIQ